MGANPEPVDTAWNREPECPEIETNSDAVQLPLPTVLKCSEGCAGSIFN